MDVICELSAMNLLKDRLTRLDLPRSGMIEDVASVRTCEARLEMF